MDKIVLPLYVGHNKDIKLADVKGRSLEEAILILDMMGFHHEVIDSTENDKFPPQTVIDQQPPPGTPVKEGRMVRLIITSGKHYFPMPNLVGTVYKAAKLELQRHHLKTYSISYEYSTDKPRDVVTGQSINPKEMVSGGEVVALVISKGPPPRQLQVPDLFGMNLDEAKAEIRRAGFQMGSIRYITNDDLVAYTIIGQSPEFGTLFDNPVRINLDVTISSHSGDQD